MAKRIEYNRPYSKSALTAKFSAGGFEEFYKKIEEAGKNLDEACENAVNRALPIVEKSMKEGAARHRRTGNVYNAIEKRDAKLSGNLIIGKVGIDYAKHPEAAEGVFQEYGDGHSPEFPDPFVRPAVDDNRTELTKIIRDNLKKEGVL